MKESSENLPHEELQTRLRRGSILDPLTPGLKEAARELIRPLVESMDGKEIVYVCRVPRLMRVKYLETDDEGFRAVALTLHHLGCRIGDLRGPTASEKALLAKARTLEELRRAHHNLPRTPRRWTLVAGGIACVCRTGPFA